MDLREVLAALDSDQEVRAIAARVTDAERGALRERLGRVLRRLDALCVHLNAPRPDRPAPRTGRLR